MTSVIIPAYNEESRIRACLSALLDDADPGEFDVIVACNGCTDATAERAREFSTSHYPLRVLDVAEASKPAALNAGLIEATSRPCIFVDADVQLTTVGARQLRAVLDRGDVLAASTSLEIDSSQADFISRSYHRYWQQLPSIKSGLAGRGVYALSSAGVERLESFPKIVADDRYIHALFGPADRETVESTSLVEAAHTTRELIARKVRVFAGNDEIESEHPVTNDGSWVDVLRARPASLIDLPAYLGVNAIAKIKARQMNRSGVISWNRDASSRTERA